MNYFNESGTYETEVKKSFDKTNIGTSSAGMNTGSSCEAGMMMDPGMCGGCIGAPIYECPQERVCHRYICHEVPHDFVKSETFNTHIDTKTAKGRFFSIILFSIYRNIII